MQYIIITPSKWEDARGGGGDYFETGGENTLCLPKVQDLAPDLYTREEEVGGGEEGGGGWQNRISSHLASLSYTNHQQCITWMPVRLHPARLCPNFFSGSGHQPFYPQLNVRTYRTAQICD